MKHRTHVLSFLCALFVVLSGIGIGGEVEVTLYHTSDLHEHSAPLARIARFVAEQRQQRKNVIFADTGDWFNKGDLTELKLRGEAMAELMGAMGYDAIIPGNHDYAHGTRRLAELIDKYGLPVAAANCTWPPGAKPRDLPAYRTFRFDGVTVAVIGTATPIMGNAADKDLEVAPIAPAVKEVLAELEGKADIIVLLTHLGPPDDKKLIRALPRVDVLLGGHHHKRFAKLNFDAKHQTVLQHSGCFGECIGEVVITWDGEKIVQRNVRLVKVTADLPEADRVAAIRRRYVAK